ncbi:MAG: helix-turn-helix domain-containing protein [Bacteroidota bacterium]
MGMIKEENIRLIFGLKLKQLRMDQGISQQMLSRKTGISVSYLNEIEKGKKYPKPDKVATLADGLGVEYDQLTSLKLGRNLAPISDLLQSNILSELPLDMFNIEANKLLEVLSSDEPNKFSAFVNTIIAVCRSYDIKLETFFFSVLRSFQEMYENYFPELETAADAFRKEYGLTQDPDDRRRILDSCLRDKFGYHIEYGGLDAHPDLQDLRSLVIPDEKSPRLLLNSSLTPRQIIFTLGREVGYSYLQLTERPYTASWVNVTSFEQVLNNFKASYFANALLMPEKPFIQALKGIFMEKAFDANRLVDLMESSGATPEMFMYRLTNLLPKHLGISDLFFFRFSSDWEVDRIELTKELHLSHLHLPHGTFLNEHYCRRWASVQALHEAKQLTEANEKTRPICLVQRSYYSENKSEFLILTLARPQSTVASTLTSVTIGLNLNETLKRKVRFWNDPGIPTQFVSTTCERCAIHDCDQRVARPVILQEEQRLETMQLVLQDLLK